MSEPPTGTVLVTQREYEKARRVFRESHYLDVAPAPDDEERLADQVISMGSRGVIVGARPYRGPLYRALGMISGGRGSIIARFGVGHDNIDKALARRRGTVVTNTPGMPDVSVAEYTIWLMGCLARKVAACNRHMGAYAATGVELRGRTLVIVGFGAIGRRVAAMASHGLGMRVLAAGRRTAEELALQERRSIEQIQADYGLTRYTHDADAILGQADFASIHLPGGEETRHFIGASRLARMKRWAFLINTARGSVVDESALYDALAGGKLAGAALDVSQHEPYQPVAPDKDLCSLDNVLLTPHAASDTRQANERMALAALSNVRNYFAGRLDKLTLVTA